MRFFSAVMVTFFVTVSAFGAETNDICKAPDTNSDLIEAQNLILEMGGVADNGLKELDIAKYKMAHLCKFIGQMIPNAERALTVNESLEKAKANPQISSNLMAIYALVYTAQNDICTVTKNPYKPVTKDQVEADLKSLTGSFRSIIAISNQK